MKRLNFAFRIILTSAWVGLWVGVFLFTRPTTPRGPIGPQEYTAFTVDLAGEWITIRNTGDEVLTDCEIEFVAELDADGEATYRGRRSYPRWEPGQAQEIGINTSRGPMNVRAVRFSGQASSPNKGQRFWRVMFSSVTSGR